MSPVLLSLWFSLELSYFKGQSILHFVCVREGQRTVCVTHQNSTSVLYAHPTDFCNHTY